MSGPTFREMADAMTTAEAVRKEMPSASKQEQLAEATKRCGSLFMAACAFEGLDSPWLRTTSASKGEP